MILADTGAILALVDGDDRHHAAVRSLYLEAPDAWLLPWVILPEVDYLIATHIGSRAQAAWLADLADGAFAVEWGREGDLAAAHAIRDRYRDLRLGLVDAAVMAIAERLRVDAIATLDVKHFGAVRIKGGPRLLPRDGYTKARSRRRQRVEAASTCSAPLRR